MTTNAGGWGSGLLGVLIFSGSLPATRVAVTDLSPLFVTTGRAVIAAVIGVVLLALFRAPRPARADLVPLVIVALGVVIGFPLLTGLALREITAAHSIVFIGLLPLATALFGVLRGGERPQPAFWMFSGLGAATVVGFALANSAGGDMTADAMMIAAVLLCGLGYADGARLSRRLGGWQVISWALLLAAPLMAVIAALTRPGDWSAIGTPAWIGFAYVSVFSMMLGFVFWYRGLSLGGIAGVGQLQLLQPFLGLILAAVVLGEPVSLTLIAPTAAVILCVAAARRFARPASAMPPRAAAVG